MSLQMSKNDYLMTCGRFLYEVLIVALYTEALWSRNENYSVHVVR